MLLTGTLALVAGLQATSSFPVVPPGRDSDLRWMDRDGRGITGISALSAMASADLVVWVAGNQYFAMDAVMAGFRAKHPGTSIGLLTLPPGLLLDALEAGGLRYGGRTWPGRPDVYGTVGQGYLDRLRKGGFAQECRTYAHNELQLMVAKGNPLGIRDLRDLTRPGVRSSLPNPLDEGIMRFHGKPILSRLGLWKTLSDDRDCRACEPAPGHWFTAVHHRETPDRIDQGKSDVGLVWRTEVLEAVRAGRPVEGIALPPEQNAGDEVAYTASPIIGSRHPRTAAMWLEHLTSPEGQQAYQSFGFAPATPEERKPRRL
ncbi:MAG: substrate-binding domain-containing protein [Candidatus Sericytochromatia bacterium]|nr:substrate-binding domain-containing protein [Candidatus Sericytochromatia bacterium]